MNKEIQFLMYSTPQGDVNVEAFVRDETLWLTQKAMAQLFGVQVPAISKHLKNIFTEGELHEEVVISKMEITTQHGAIEGKTQTLETQFYNLDAIISVGYRVNSAKATHFRIWATNVLKEYMLKGFVLDDERLKQGGQVFGKDYFRELLERIRSIRASERRIWQQITDIFAECSLDYDRDSDITKDFYAMVQNKFHYAITGQTAAEIICSKADSTKENMGLTTWKHSPDGRILKSDVMSRLRTFFNWCVGKYIEVSPFKNYSIPEPVYGTPVFITTSELNILAKLDLSSRPDLEVQRDIFVFQSCVGCRVGDLYKMTRSNIVNGVVYYIAGKTKDDNPRTLAIPLVSMAMKIVDKYDDPKRSTLFPFIHEQYYNIAIKEIFKLAGTNRVVTLLDPTTRKEVRVPISEYASSHMARRTFCGNVYKNVKDPSIVGSMSGHKEGSKALARYRDIDQDIKKDALSVFE